MENFWKILLVVIVAIISSIIVLINVKSWYKKYIIAPKTIPDYCFGIVWIFIYITYAYIWCNIDGQDILFILNLFVGLFWILVFFGMHNIQMAKYMIVSLLVIILYQTLKIWKYGSVGFTFIMLIYASWILCASGINFSIYYR